ncbi:MAG: putative membrane protein YeiH [Arenicella sp.]|jgi:uncharacterized membrane protein YeiH
MDIPVLFIADLLGVFVFALSGALAAARKKMDIFGYMVLAVLPAVGGGTVRDLILNTSVFWVEQSVYILVAVGAGVITFLVSVRVGQRYTVLEWADAIGLSLFCVLGASKALSLTGDPVLAVTLGVVTAVVGGILRDVVCNEVPLILKREIYATAAMIGALAYCLGVGLSISEELSLLIGGVSAFSVRSMALIFGWSLPIRERKAQD